MGDVPNQDAATLVVYETAIEALPPLTREVFLLHRVDELSYRQIAERLSIGISAVEGCIAETLSMISAILDGETPRRWRSNEIAEAEALLRQRYRRCCEGRLRAAGVSEPIAWDDKDDDAAAMFAMLHAMPPAMLDTFLLKQVGQLTYAQLAGSMGTSQWIVLHRMLCAIRHVARRPEPFEEWLKGLT